MSRSPRLNNSPEKEGKGTCEKLQDTAAASGSTSTDRSHPGGNTYVFPIRSVYQREQAREEAKHYRPSPASTSLSLGLTDAIFGSPPSRPSGIQRASSDSIHETIHEMLEHRGDLASNRTMSSMSFKPKPGSSRSSIPSPTSRSPLSLPKSAGDSPPPPSESQRPSLRNRPTAVRVPTVSSTNSGNSGSAESSDPLSTASKDMKDRPPSLSTNNSQDTPQSSEPRHDSVTTTTSSDPPETPATGSLAGGIQPPPKPPSQLPSDPTGLEPVRSPVTLLEPNEEGIPSLVNDFMDIIRLDGAAQVPTPSSQDNATSGKSGRSTLYQPQPSAVSRIASTMIPGSTNLGPTMIRQDPSASGSSPSINFSGNGTRAAQAQALREQKEHSVRDFINEQARTVQISDPNEASPSTSPVPDSDMPQSEQSSSSQDELQVIAPKAERWDETSTTPQTGQTSPDSDQRRSDKGSSSNSRTNTASGSGRNTGSGSGSGTGSGGTPTGTGTGSRLDSALATSSDSFEASEPAVTFRFQHLQREDGHHIITGREGTIVRCEDEPITTPGAIQSFGVLIVLEWDYDTDNLVVRQVSENSTEILGLSPAYLFSLTCFTNVLPPRQADILQDTIEGLDDPIAQDAEPKHANEGPQIFRLSGYTEHEPGDDPTVFGDSISASGSRSTRSSTWRTEWTCWVAAHRPRQPQWDRTNEAGESIPPPDLIVLEFELEQDVFNPLSRPRGAPDMTSDAPTPNSRLTPGSASLASGSSGSFRPTTAPTTSPSSDEMFGTRRSAETESTVPTTVQSESVSSIFSPVEDDHQRAPMGIDGRNEEIPLERILASTTNHAKPLRGLGIQRQLRDLWHTNSDSGSSAPGNTRGSRGARAGRRSRRGHRSSTVTDALDVFSVLNQVNDQLGRAQDIASFLNIVVGVVKDLCRFHRVLFYKFDEDYNGEVVSELVDWGRTTDLWKGLRFPASDIPPQARELYKINKKTARLVLRDKSDLEYPLDMTYSYLRAMSPIHLKYLANMEVRSSMSISIMAFGKLWGLIACHSYGHHGKRVSFPLRQIFSLMSDQISRNIERLTYAHRLNMRSMIHGAANTPGPSAKGSTKKSRRRGNHSSDGPDSSASSSSGSYLVSNADALLTVFDADAGLLVINDGCKLLGQSEQGHAMLAIAEYLRIAKFTEIKSSFNIQKDFPDLVLPRGKDTIAGMLYIPLTTEAGQDFIVFFRKGEVYTIKWAGKPYRDPSAHLTAILEPRASFKLWLEQVTGRSRQWTDDQMDAAGVLSIVYGKFIQVWRERQNTMVSNQLTAILLSNTSHAVRTPLSQIINTLELALAGDIDADTRRMLENSHSASRALLFHVHDLLDLTRIETGNETAFSDPFDLKQTISDTVRLYETESKRRGIDFNVKVDGDLPQMVIGDSRKIRTLISNLAANAVKYTTEGTIEISCRIEPGTVPMASQMPGEPDVVSVEITISDTGCGIHPGKLESMFITMEGAEDRKGGGIGLGLAVVARIVEQLAGQLRAESEVNKGTKFYFTCNMGIIDDGSIIRKPSNNLNSLYSTSDSQSMVRVGKSGSSLASSGRLSKSSTSSKSKKSKSSKSSSGKSHKSGNSSKLSSVDSGDPLKSVASQGSSGLSSGVLSGVSSGVASASFPTANSLKRRGITPSASPNPTQKSGDPPKASITPIMDDRDINISVEKALKDLKLKEKHEKAQGAKTGNTTPGTPAKRPVLRQRKTPEGLPILRVLVVEDDIVNSQILQKRLRMERHSVIAVSNGQEAVDALLKDWDIDVVLMDIQMPIMDGFHAAEEIRKLESTGVAVDGIDPVRVDGRIPIFAVSASLYEHDRGNLSKNFDGWLLKPVNFARIRSILLGLEDPQKRDAEVYKSGHWEAGGYFNGANRLVVSGL